MSARRAREPSAAKFQVINLPPMLWDRFPNFPCCGPTCGIYFFTGRSGGRKPTRVSLALSIRPERRAAAWRATLTDCAAPLARLPLGEHLHDAAADSFLRAVRGLPAGPSALIISSLDRRCPPLCPAVRLMSSYIVQSLI